MAHIFENEQLQKAVFPVCSAVAGRPVDQL